MMTGPVSDPELQDATIASPRRTHTGPLLIAGEDADYMRGAFLIAELLARRDRVNAHILGVVRPLDFPASLFVDLDRDALEEGRRQIYLERLRQRLHQATGTAPFFTLEVATGRAAPTLARAARDRGSELIMVGLEEREGARNRAVTEDAALQVTRAAETPVLSVPAEFTRLPKHALVAMDFGAPSQRAAQAAIPLLAHGARLTLAYVEPEIDFAALGKDGWAAIHAKGVAELFRKLSATLSVPGDVSVETAVLRGDPAEALLDRARDGAFDLIATGTQGETALERHLTGSVSTALLRGARCPVLIAPQPAAG